MKKGKESGRWFNVAKKLLPQLYCQPKTIIYSKATLLPMTRQEQILQMRAEGKSMTAIGKDLGISAPRVCQLISRYKKTLKEQEAQALTLNPVNPETLNNTPDKQDVLKSSAKDTDIQDIKEGKVLQGLLKARESIMVAINSQSPEDLKGERLRDLVVSAGIMIDKVRLIQGDPTAIFRHQAILVDMSDADLRRIAGVEIPGQVSVVIDAVVSQPESASEITSDKHKYVSSDKQDKVIDNQVDKELCTGK